MNGFRDHIGRNVHKDTTKVKENPFWFEDIIKDAEQHYNNPDNGQQLQHHHQHHHNARRAKRNHHKKLKAIYHNDNEKILAKRSVELFDDDYPQDEIFSPSEVIGNIFNENDTLTFGGIKDNGMS